MELESWQATFIKQNILNLNKRRLLVFLKKELYYKNIKNTIINVLKKLSKNPKNLIFILWMSQSLVQVVYENGFIIRQKLITWIFYINLKTITFMFHFIAIHTKIFLVYLLVFVKQIIWWGKGTQRDIYLAEIILYRDIKMKNT